MIGFSVLYKTFEHIQSRSPPVLVLYKAHYLFTVHHTSSMSYMSGSGQMIMGKNVTSSVRTSY